MPHWSRRQKRGTRRNAKPAHRAHHVVRRRNSQHATDAPERGGARVQFAKAGGRTRKYSALHHNDDRTTQHKGKPRTTTRASRAHGQVSNHNEGAPHANFNRARDQRKLPATKYNASTPCAKCYRAQTQHKSPATNNDEGKPRENWSRGTQTRRRRRFRRNLTAKTHSATPKTLNPNSAEIFVNWLPQPGEILKTG